MTSITSLPSYFELAIFQNYFSPSRHEIFEELGRSCRLVVFYMQSAADEGRHWIEETPTTYVAYRLPTRQFAKVVLPAGPCNFPRHVEVAVMVDNNPTNVAMLLLAAKVRKLAARTYLWVEHIPDPSKGRAKTLYQTLTSRALLRFCDAAASFSSMTDTYLSGLGYQGAIQRIPQVVPSPPSGRTWRSVTQLRTFGYLGSNVERKNLNSLRLAIGSIERLDIKLHLAGHKISDLSVREKTLGYVSGDDLEDFFDSIDMLVLPSRIDPWGLVVNEALMRGRLALVSRFCGSAEIVEKIDPRFVCGLSPVEVQNAVEYAASLNPGEISDRLERARDVMRTFSVPAAARAFQRL